MLIPTCTSVSTSTFTMFITETPSSCNYVNISSTQGNTYTTRDCIVLLIFKPIYQIESQRGISSTSLAVSITLTLLITAVITTIISSLVKIMLTKRYMHHERNKEDKFVKQPPPAVYEEPSSFSSMRVASNPAYGQVNIK